MQARPELLGACTHGGVPAHNIAGVAQRKQSGSNEDTVAHMCRHLAPHHGDAHCTRPQNVAQSLPGDTRNRYCNMAYTAMF